MKRLQLVSQGTLDRIHLEAQAAWEARDLDKSIGLLEKIRRMSPADIKNLLQLGRIYGYAYDYTSAERCFELAVRFSPPNQKAGTLATAGIYSRDFYNPEIAERYHVRATKEPGAGPEVFVTLAEVYEKRRRLDEAAGLVDEALRRDPRSTSALFLRGQLQHRRGKHEDAEQTLRPLLDFHVPKDTRVRAGYELGAVLDRQGRYDDAMAAFVQAKTLLESDAARFLASRKSLTARVNEMRTQVTAEVFKRWYASRDQLQPIRRVSLLGGHPRSGTTLLEQVLDAHPSIVTIEESNNFMDYSSMPLERKYPSGTPVLNVLESTSNEMLISRRNEYFRIADLCLGSPVGDRLLIDKNPSLTLWIPHLARVFPEIKFLIALRDPRDVVLSCFMQPMLPVQHIGATWLNLKTAADEYAFVMNSWVTFAPRLASPYLEVRYEDMVQDLESSARRILEFFDIPWDERVLGFDEHARHKGVRSPTYADVTQKIFTRAVGRWRNYQKYLEPCQATLEPFVKAFGYE